MPGFLLRKQKTKLLMACEKRFERQWRKKTLLKVIPLPAQGHRIIPKRISWISPA
jgi:hypothetical protein